MGICFAMSLAASELSRLSFIHGVLIIAWVDSWTITVSGDLSVSGRGTASSATGAISRDVCDFGGTTAKSGQAAER